MKSSLLRNTIVTSALAVVMACAMPLSASAQERDRDGRDGNDARYYSRRDADRAPARDDFYRDQRDRGRDENDFRHDWRHSRDDSYRAPRDRDRRWRDADRRRGDDWRRSDFRPNRDEDNRGDGRDSRGFFYRANPRH